MVHRYFFQRQRYMRLWNHTLLLAKKNAPKKCVSHPRVFFFFICFTARILGDFRPFLFCKLGIAVAELSWLSFSIFSFELRLRRLILQHCGTLALVLGKNMGRCWVLGCPRKLVNGQYMGYNLLINGIYWGYNLLTNLLLTSWDIQVVNLEEIKVFI